MVIGQWNGEPESEGPGVPNARTIISPDGYKPVLHDCDVSMLFDHKRGLRRRTAFRPDMKQYERS